MSVLFHPHLGRFSHLEELHASGTDSDSYYGHGLGRRYAAAAPRPSRREGATGAPGSRRHRLFMNATFADYESEYDTASDWDSDEDRPIVRFEWQATFVAGTGALVHQSASRVRGFISTPRFLRLMIFACFYRCQFFCLFVFPSVHPAGSEFFDGRVADAAIADQTGGARVRSRQHRPLRMMRRPRGAAPTIPASFGPGGEFEDDDEDYQQQQQASATGSKESELARVRKIRAAKFAPTSVAAASASHTTDSDCLPSSPAPAAPRVRRMVGQESAPSLFLHIESSIRRALRKGATSVPPFVEGGAEPMSEERAFLSELESLLIAYKNGHLKDDSICCPHTFELLPYEVTRAHATADEDDTEATSDDDLVHVDVRRRTASGEEPLHLSFRNARERFLAHGLAQFHQLVATSHDAPQPQRPVEASGEGRGSPPPPLRVTAVRLPKAGVLLHQAHLVAYLDKLARAHAKQMAR